MGECILVYGKSGAGKSRSLQNFGEDEILFVNTINKRLPFSKKFKGECRLPENSAFQLTDANGNPKGQPLTGVMANIERIKLQMQRMTAKGVYTAVIDDSGYLMTALFMADHTSGKNYELYNNIGDIYWKLFRFVKNELPDEVIVYFIMHDDTDDSGNNKLRTIGKLLDQKVCLEGMVTICLHAIAAPEGHFFLTNSDGHDICKSPEGMFSLRIPNDLKMVDDTIRDFWDLHPKSAEEKTADPKEEKPAE